MDQTQKYIKVLNWGYGGFAPMTLSPDYKASLEQAQQRLSLLDDLDYNALLNEALGKGKDYLARYTKTDDTFEYGLHFMTNLNNLIESLQPDYWDNEKKEQVINHNRMFRGILNGADKLRAEGLWTDEQWKEYRATINQIEKDFEDRLKQFAAAYDYNDKKQVATEQQKDLHYYCKKAVDKGYFFEVSDGYRIKNKEWTKAQLAYFLKHFPNTDGTFPDKKYCVMFGESRLSKAVDQLSTNKNGDGKPRGYEIVDELLQE